MEILDFRSDTITLPTKEMKEAMLNCSLGDDVYGEDPTVNELEEKASKIFNKEAALLVSSGTQGNLLGVLSQTDGRGSEIIVESEAHIYYYEVGGISVLGNVLVKPIKGSNGALTPDQVQNAIRPLDIHQPVTKLISLEQTHNRAGGQVIPQKILNSVGKLAKDNKMGFHVDGARIFNAATYLKTSVASLCESATTVTFCLSKGLAAPIGSVLVGSQDIIDRARTLRKMVGGGMRQAGIIAAPGLIALEKMTKRLHQDHHNAQILVKGLEDVKNWQIKQPQTNIVKIRVPGNAKKIKKDLKEKVNILVGTMDSNTIRFVTHYHITEDEVQEALKRIHSIF
ncbi:MAG: low-specificity L-threonine aldolase [Candidatus Hodarchaeales archaeon]|jgi:threonine aldolase